MERDKPSHFVGPLFFVSRTKERHCRLNKKKMISADHADFAICVQLLISDGVGWSRKVTWISRKPFVTNHHLQFAKSVVGKNNDELFYDSLLAGLPALDPKQKPPNNHQRAPSYGSILLPDQSFLPSAGSRQLQCTLYGQTIQGRGRPGSVYRE
jgi:hypothetical protein